jgi:hypothetical protein
MGQFVMDMNNGDWEMGEKPSADLMNEKHYGSLASVRNGEDVRIG